MPPRKAWKIYSALLFSTFVTLEAAAFQLPAIPTIAAHFKMPVSLAALIVLLYYLGVVVLSPIMGRLADQVGRKRMILSGLTVFAIAEFVAALSPSLSIFLVARLFQGAGVACILPVTLAYVGYLFPPEKRGMALGVFGTMTSVGVTTGSLIAGLLVDKFGWEIIYWISGGLAVVGLLLTTLFVEETPLGEKPKGFDLPGALLLLTGVASMLSIPPLMANVSITSPYVTTALVLTIVSFSLLAWQENRAPTPILDVSLLRIKQFRLALAVQFLTLVPLIIMIYCMAFFVQGRPGGSATNVGLMTMTMYGAGIFGAPLIGKLSDIFHARNVIIANSLILLIGLLMFASVTADTPLWFILVMVGIVGFCNSGQAAPVMKMMLGAVPKHKLGTGTGLYSMTRDLATPTGSAIGLSLYGVQLHRGSGESLERQLEGHPGAEFLPQLIDSIGRKGVEIQATLVDQLKNLDLSANALLQQAAQEGASLAINSVAMISLGSCLVLLILTWLLPRKAHGAATQNVV